MAYKISNDIKYELEGLLVRSRESTNLEFKEKFDFAQFAKYAKALVGFANNSGGRIIFGVRSKPHTIIGCDDDSIPDEAKLTTWLQNYFDPFIDFKISNFIIEEKVLIEIRVNSSTNKPVVAKKTYSIDDKAIIEESTIYYRYAGKTEKIRFPELQEILKNREERLLKSLIDGVKAIHAVGHDKASVIDLNGLLSKSEMTKIFINQDSLKKINLIKEGHFVESRNEGSSAYFIEGALNLQIAEPIFVEDTDRYTVRDVVMELTDIVKEIIHQDAKLVGSHLANFAKVNGFRDISLISAGENYSNDYCKYDCKARMWFYRKKFIECVKEKMIQSPRDAAVELGIAKKIRDLIQSELAE